METLWRAEQPACTFDEACARFEATLQDDTAEVDPGSRSRLATPGHRTERAFVFFHGLGNAPPQFDLLTQRMVARGYAVYTPRLPFHGHQDRLTNAPAQLSVAQLVDATAAAVDLASGLADEISVSGISLGGVLAIWAAQFRPVAFAAPIAPAIGLPMLPLRATPLMFRGVRRLPNRFIWWDPRAREKLPGPPYAYPRFSTHALAETQRLGLLLLNAATYAAPRAGEVCLITNAFDLAVNNAASNALLRRWRTAGARNVNMFRFPRRLKLMHDIVDPLQPYAHTDVVYPVLERILGDREAANPYNSARPG